MHYKVFLDTNIYDSASFAFRNALFSQLTDLASADLLELQINSVVKGEVIKHIKKDIKIASNNLNTILSSRSMALFRHIPEYNERMLIYNPNTWVETALKEFDSFLDGCHFEEITSNDIDVEKIVSDYFLQQYPFEAAKKDEFPDAITIQAISNEIKKLSKNGCFSNYNNDNLYYCVVSNDKGFNNALKSSVGDLLDVKLFDSLDKFINYIAVQDKDTKDLQDVFNTGYANELIESTIKESLDVTYFVINEPGGCVEDVSNLGTGDYNYSVNVMSLIKNDDGSKYARLYVETKFSVMLDYSYLNEDESYWDKEEKRYFWEVITYVKAKFNSETSIIFDIRINEDDFSEFIDFIDFKSTIELDAADADIINTESIDRG